MNSSFLLKVHKKINVGTILMKFTSCVYRVIKLLLNIYYRVNTCYVSIIYCYNDRSGIGEEWERNGSGLHDDKNLVIIL
ncbi:hypothetical protein DWW18_01795 [Butyricimonas virosa]|uniref:Uncharacterized protein n=1 Tax=Butyricimonas virosa TaxID=544645 RepID=A0A412X4V5_9BACT|nr:hypothetical protein DWW18_01795 [Butyricimonas virosa]